VNRYPVGPQIMMPPRPQIAQGPQMAAPPDPFMLLAGELRGLRQDVARFAQLQAELQARSNGGDNPFGYPPRPATVYEHGVGHSGPRVVIGPEDNKQILNVALKEIVPQGYYGMATIHVAVSPVAIIPHAVDEFPNGVLIGHVHWQSGDGGGDEDVDLTRGGIITVGGTTALVIEAEFVPNNTSPLIVFESVAVETTVSWETSADKDAAMTLPAEVLAANVAGQFYRIPRQARSMLALGAPAAAYATLIARFLVENVVGTPIAYEVPDPFRNGAPIRNGVNFVQFINTVPMTRNQPTFDLW